VTGTLTTEGFGQTVATTGSSSNPYMFAAPGGERNDGDAGLMHVGARYYDAQVGRFVTRDTVLSEHRYIYCNADPVNAVDPTGHQRTVQWYVNVVQAIILQNWDMLVTLIVIVGGDEIPPEVIQVLTPTHPLPAMNTNPTAVGEVRGLIKQLVSHIEKAAEEGAGNPSYRHQLGEIRAFWGRIVKKLKR
jgi:RHS repeat-associated protein